MTTIQIATIAIALTIKAATLLFVFLARRNQRRNAAESAANRVSIGTDAYGTPVYLSASADVVDAVIRRRRDNA
ncbi:hypothetical protein [Nonomuraea basaltis]|uniref:hypothetical protein n=1 Tax=Nonomuraea basaltis TaxID=2495887 RepID=UPI00110C5CEF|nr:hypothetical protein [Nonomuraea basaltis]TMR92567.1 hypothetical protein EJK15_43985 [Nonomuraea basaltis]